MKKADYETMTFCKDQYDGNLDVMWQDISKFLQIILKNENLCTIHREDFDIIVIRYQHDDTNSGNAWGCDQPIWLTCEEQNQIFDQRAMQSDINVEASDEDNSLHID